MNKLSATILSIVIVLAILIVISVAWWNMGWTSFQYGGGDVVKFASKTNAAGLKFSNCMFTVTRLDGASATQDVSSILNRMASAYKGASSPPATLDLAGPLTPFSFLIVGFNDKNVTSPNSPVWQGASVKLTGSMRNI